MDKKTVKLTTAQQNVINRLKTGEIIRRRWDRIWRGDNNWGINSATIDRLIELGIVKVGRIPGEREIVEFTNVEDQRVATLARLANDRGKR
jgi:hypothetical protein